MSGVGIFLGLVVGFIGGFVAFSLDRIRKKKALKETLLNQNITHYIDGKKVNMEKFVNGEKDYLEKNTQVDHLSEVNRKLPKGEKEKPKADRSLNPVPPSPSVHNEETDKKTDENLKKK